LKHYNVLSMFLVLIVGVWTIVEFRQRSRSYPEHKLGWLWRFLVFYNALAVVVFLSSYGQSNFSPDQLAKLDFWYRIGEWPILAAIVLGAHVSLYAFIFQRRNRSLPVWLIAVTTAFVVAVMIWYFLALKNPSLSPSRPDNTFWLALIWPPGLFDVVWLGVLWAESRKAADPGRRKVDAAFAVLMLIRYPVHMALTVWTPVGAMAWALTLARLLGLYTNLVPLIWLRSYFLPWAGGLAKAMAAKFDLQAIGRARGLSPREMEILALMIDGKSYKEIESGLHISIHTVKSHVYSLYRKMDVTSRHQLIHKIGVYGSGFGPPGPSR
jgi:DNA-binding CsgD family transcriptional regulator